MNATIHYQPEGTDMSELIPAIARHIVLLGIAASFSIAGARTTAQSRSKVHDALVPFAEKGAIAGAVALTADHEKVLDVTSVGYADVAAKLPMKANNLFWIASQSKPITATALMMLVDEGKVKLDDPVEKYLPEFRGQWLLAENAGDHQTLKRPSHAITVREILSHTSGLPFSSSIENPTLDQRPLRERVVSYALSPLQFEPGTKYSYSNAGINTAGRIIEVASGMPYEEFLKERLFKPLGMKDTTFWPTPAQVARLAKSYSPDAAKTGLTEVTVTQLRYPLSDHSIRYPMPAGGLFSTAADLTVFCQMVMNKGEWKGKRYLSEAAIKEMTSKQTGSLPDGYGLGWSTGGGNFGHGGAYATNMNIDTNRGLITIWMVQSAGGYPLNGDQAYGAFRTAAEATFGNGKH
jgi:CubicO group peptidase (beta-lactamase class C family)